MNRRLVALLAVTAITLGVAGVSNLVAADPQPVFTATFDTASDFYNRFDMGYSGYAMGQNGNPNLLVSGDHSTAVPCGGPTTSRNVTLTGTSQSLDFSQLFWWCAPSGDASSGHIMTGHDTVGYNIAWFSPHPEFTDVNKVCWDINETMMSRRKWTQVVFVPHADAVRYPAGATNNELPSNTSRGTGGFDLGFVNPDFRSANGPTDGIVSHAGTFGLRDLDGSASTFLDGQNLSQFVGPDGANREQTDDKAARYPHCLENGPNNTVIYTKGTPVGTFVRNLVGQIPQGQIRVVFEDDEYDGRKDDRFNANVLTWHWDNIQVYAGSAPPPPTTTTLPATTTTLPSTTVTTTTVPTTTTSTVPDPCPSTFNDEERAWCRTVEARLP